MIEVYKEHVVEPPRYLPTMVTPLQMALCAEVSVPATLPALSP